VEKHGGRISFRSKEGHGTVFTVDFPTTLSRYEQENRATA